MTAALPPTRAQRRRRTAGWLLLAAGIVVMGLAMATAAFGIGGHADPGFGAVLLALGLTLLLIVLAALFFVLSFFGRQRDHRYI
jgi:uncharacterized membrane protein